MTALISDCFWYMICKIFKNSDGKYKDIMFEIYDRISANMVSFFINSMPENLEGEQMARMNIARRSKEPRSPEDCFFLVLYDVIAQCVFFSLYFAYPKSRNQLKYETIITLLEELSLLFNGISVKKPQCNHWNLDLGTGNVIDTLRASKYIYIYIYRT